MASASYLSYIIFSALDASLNRNRLGSYIIKGTGDLCFRPQQRPSTNSAYYLRAELNSNALWCSSSFCSIIQVRTADNPRSQLGKEEAKTPSFLLS